VHRAAASGGARPGVAGPHRPSHATQAGDKTSNDEGWRCRIYRRRFQTAGDLNFHSDFEKKSQVVFINTSA
jgi:hypothetical protein